MTTPQQHASNPTLNNLAAESKRVADQERARRAALELQMKHTEAVLNLEKKLDIVERWKPSDPEWEAAARMVARRRYQRCVDELEASVVARIFELGEMNRAHTGTCGVSGSRGVCGTHGVHGLFRLQAPHAHG